MQIYANHNALDLNISLMSFSPTVKLKTEGKFSLIIQKERKIQKISKRMKCGIGIYLYEFLIFYLLYGV